jgi:tetratricopeptide (TPR) repeat protein
MNKTNIERICFAKISARLNELLLFLRTANRFKDAKQAIEKWSNPEVDAETVAYEYGWLFEVQGKIQQAIRYYERAALISRTSANYKICSADIARCKQKLERFSSPDEL